MKSEQLKGLLQLQNYQNLII